MFLGLPDPDPLVRGVDPEIVLKNWFFGSILKVNDENSRIRIQDPDPDPEARIRGSGFGSTPKCHGSGTLIGNSQKIWGFGQDHGLFAEPDSELGFS